MHLGLVATCIGSGKIYIQLVSIVFRDPIATVTLQSAVLCLKSSIIAVESSKFCFLTDYVTAWMSDMHYAGPPRADAGPWTDGFPGAFCETMILRFPWDGDLGRNLCPSPESLDFLKICK
jgi:hypothetical protein